MIILILLGLCLVCGAAVVIYQGLPSDAADYAGDDPIAHFVGAPEEGLTFNWVTNQSWFVMFTAGMACFILGVMFQINVTL